jgi:predicted nucleotidyltransferase
MTIKTKFGKFLANLELTDAQKQDAETKHTRVRKSLHEAFYSTPYNGKTSLVVGSYGKHTAIRPTSDIDILFLIPGNEFPRYEGLQGNKQSRLLQDIKSRLVDLYPNTDLRADGQVVSVPMTTYKVEVVPGFLGEEKRYWICDTNNGGSWKLVDPHWEMNTLAASDTRSAGNTRRLIKMMKTWKRFCNVPIKSFAIEIMVRFFLQQWAHYNCSIDYYHWIMKNFFDYLIPYAGGTYTIPTTKEPIALVKDWKSKAESALARAKKAYEFEINRKSDSATEEWKKIFGPSFNFTESPTLVGRSVNR